MQNRYKFSSLYVRDFRIFWFAQLISLSGTWMHSTAQSWLVYLLTKSPLYLGAIATISSLPILFFTLIGGMVADRYPKRDILIVTQAVSIIPAFFIAILIDIDMITIWYIGIAAFIIGLVNAFDVPARHAFIGELVGKADITNAIALNSVAFNGARIVGPVIAVFIISIAGLQTCFYLNAASFIPVILALLTIKAKGTGRLEQVGFLSDLIAGWGFIVREKAILFIMLMIAVFSLFGIPYLTLLPILAGDILDVGAHGFSTLLACAGLGSLVAALIIAYRKEIDKKSKFLSLSGFTFSSALFGLAISNDFYLSCILITMVGWGITSFLATSNSYIQHSVPDLLRGRVMSFYTLVFLGFLPLGNALTGFAADMFGTMNVLRVFSLFCLFCSIIFALKLSSVKRSDI
jgi:MFS family permease